jgi:hypothetical protein
MRTGVKTWLKWLAVAAVTASIVACNRKAAEAPADASTAAANDAAAASPGPAASADPMTQVPPSRSAPSSAPDSSLQ